MANEKRLIDANALKAIYDERYDSAFMQMHTRDNKEYWNGVCGGVNGCRNILADTTTVDAVEVVHGHWQIRPNPYRVFAHEFACSVCGGWKHKLSYEHENMNYCPNCGAKMDGDGNG